ncbi:ALIX V-shaped domain-containing protein [Gautieria morchelliformis]|nr:ALIX V-shaped domain-containing protein [Gautieria morchelliformis]
MRQSDIAMVVPSSTLSDVSEGGSKSTQGHTRALRSHLETLDDLVQARANLVGCVEQLAASDDIAPRFIREAASVAMWVEVRPEIFEWAIEEELSKYDKFREELEDGGQRQEEALEGIKERNTLLLDSRWQDPSVKAREHALQSLDLAYHKYCDICRHLTEGIKFYNDFAAILAQFKESFKVIVYLKRQAEKHDFELFKFCY